VPLPQPIQSGLLCSQGFCRTARFEDYENRGCSEFKEICTSHNCLSIRAIATKALEYQALFFHSGIPTNTLTQRVTDKAQSFDNWKAITAQRRWYQDCIPCLGHAFGELGLSGLTMQDAQPSCIVCLQVILHIHCLCANLGVCTWSFKPQTAWQSCSHLLTHTCKESMQS